MRIGVALSVCLLVSGSIVQNTAEAQGKGGRKGANDANCAGDGQQGAMMQARMQQGGMQQGGMQQGGMQQGGSPAQMAQMLLANFDKDGDGALQQAELEQAMLAMMQRMQQMQQMQQRQQMQGGGAMQSGAAAGMMGGRGQSSQRIVSGAGVQNRAQNSAQRGGSRGARGSGKRR